MAISPFANTPQYNDPADKYKTYWEKHPNLNPNQAEPTPKPKPLGITDLFPRIDRWGIGILDTLQYFQEVGNLKPSYPPYNIVKDGFKWEIAVAVAGFTKDDLSVETAQNALAIRTNPAMDFDKKDIREVVHQGIAQRNFELQFALAEHVVVKSAEMKDGLLIVKLEQEIPEEKKIKSVEIQ